MNKDAIQKSISELNSIEKMLSTLEPYSDDWFVWNELRLEEERKIRCYLIADNRLKKRESKQR